MRVSGFVVGALGVAGRVAGRFPVARGRGAIVTRAEALAGGEGVEDGAALAVSVGAVIVVGISLAVVAGVVLRAAAEEAFRGGGADAAGSVSRAGELRFV